MVWADLCLPSQLQTCACAGCLRVFLSGLSQSYSVPERLQAACGPRKVRTVVPKRAPHSISPAIPSQRSLRFGTTLTMRPVRGVAVRREASLGERRAEAVSWAACNGACEAEPREPRPASAATISPLRPTSAYPRTRTSGIESLGLECTDSRTRPQSAAATKLASQERLTNSLSIEYVLRRLEYPTKFRLRCEDGPPPKKKRKTRSERNSVVESHAKDETRPCVQLASGTSQNASRTSPKVRNEWLRKVSHHQSALHILHLHRSSVVSEPELPKRDLRTHLYRKVAISELE